MQLRTQGNRIEPSKFGSKPRFSNGGSMRLNITAMSMASGLLWGASILNCGSQLDLAGLRAGVSSAVRVHLPWLPSGHRHGLGRYRDDLCAGGWRHRRSDLWVALQPFRGA